MAYSRDLADMDYHRLSWTVMDHHGLSQTIILFIDIDTGCPKKNASFVQF